MLRMIGLSDDVTTCDCCNRTKLKRTVVLTESESNYPSSGEVKFYGSTCAAQVLKAAGAAGFKRADEMSSTKINRMAQAAQCALNRSRQAEAVNSGLVECSKGFYFLPGQSELSRSAQYKNLLEVYPFFQS